MQQQVSPLVCLLVHSQRQQQHMKAPSSSFFSTSPTNFVDLTDILSGYSIAASMAILLVVSAWSPLLASWSIIPFISSIVLIGFFIKT